MARKSTAVATAEAKPPANLGDMVMALLAKPEVTTELVDRAERLLNMHRQQVYAEAMVACQTEIEPVFKDKESDKGKYASFEALDRAIRPIYVRHGFSLSFGTADCPYPDRVRVTVDVIHTSGMVKHDFVDMPIVTKGARGNDVMTPTHATMSAISYAKRGLETMIFNIITTEDRQFDDDGNGGNVFITEQDIGGIRERLVALGDMSGDQEAALCAYLGIEKLEELRQPGLKKALAAITQKEKALAKKASQDHQQAGNPDKSPSDSAGDLGNAAGDPGAQQ
jgi:hypothetical protein